MFISVVILVVVPGASFKLKFISTWPKRPNVVLNNKTEIIGVGYE